jgi:hypothetical protein
MAQTVQAARRNVSTPFHLPTWPSRATRHRLVYHHRPTFTVDTQYGPYIWKSVSRNRQKVRLVRLGDLPPTSHQRSHPTLSLLTHAVILPGLCRPRSREPRRFVLSPPLSLTEQARVHSPIRRRTTQRRHRRRLPHSTTPRDDGEQGPGSLRRS